MIRCTWMSYRLGTILNVCLNIQQFSSCSWLRQRLGTFLVPDSAVPRLHICSRRSVLDYPNSQPDPPRCVSTHNTSSRCAHVLTPSVSLMRHLSPTLLPSYKAAAVVLYPHRLHGTVPGLRQTLDIVPIDSMSLQLCDVVERSYDLPWTREGRRASIT